MTFKRFTEVENFIYSEEKYYCWVCARTHSKEEEEKYEELRKRGKKIAEFREKVLAEAVKKLPDDYF
jgi:hypothetical protein